MALDLLSQSARSGVAGMPAACAASIRTSATRAHLAPHDVRTGFVHESVLGLAGLGLRLHGAGTRRSLYRPRGRHERSQAGAICDGALSPPHGAARASFRRFYRFSPVLAHPDVFSRNDHRRCASFFTRNRVVGCFALALRLPAGHRASRRFQAGLTTLAMCCRIAADAIFQRSATILRPALAFRDSC
jgi:hypothetical protein